MKEKILQLRLSDKESLGVVRTLPGLLVAETETHIWVRGIMIKEKPNLGISRLPATATYLLDEDHNLFPVGKLTPIGKLPKLEWQPISKFIEVKLPTSAFPGVVEKKHLVRLIPSEKMQPGKALLTNLSVWKKYAEGAPKIRLNQLRFAVSENREVLILGNPLPPIPGKEFWQKHNLLIPNGFDFEIPMVADLIFEKENTNDDAILIFHENKNWQKINLKHFVNGSRSAVRLTVAAMKK